MSRYAVNGKEPTGAWLPTYDDAGNGTATLNDLGDNGRHGTLTNMNVATVWVADVDATFGGVRRIDTDGVNDFISLPFAAFPGAYPFSISVWVKATGVTNYAVLVADIGSLNALFGVGINSSGNGFSQSGDGGGSAVATSTNSIASGTWGHITAIFTSTTSRSVYLNNAGLTTNTASNTPSLASLDNISIGALRRSSVFYYATRFDDLRIFSSVLDASDRSYLATRRGRRAGGGGRLINGTSLVRPAGIADHSPLIIGAT